MPVFILNFFMREQILCQLNITSQNSRGIKKEK